MATRLGLPGDLVGDSTGLLPADWKAGGLIIIPTVFGRAEPPLSCHVCSQKLVLVSQVSDPIASPVRAFAIFGCVQQGCGRQPGSWRAFTFLSPEKEVVEQTLAQPAECLQAAEEDSKNVYWGTDSLDWGSGNDISSHEHLLPQANGDARDDLNRNHTCAQQAGQVPAGSLCRDSTINSTINSTVEVRSQDEAQHGSSFDDLVSKLDNALQIRDQPSARIPDPKQSPNETVHSDQIDCIQIGDEKTALPEFQLWQALEPSAKQHPMHSSDQQHVSELLVAYQQEEGWSTQKEATSPASVWAGENYEADAVKAVDSAFIKFTKRLRRRPEQCLRFGGSLLWPGKQLPAAATEKCQKCGGSLTFVLQLTPALMPMLEEAAQWLQDSPEAEQWVTDWDWATVAVFWCPKGCSLKQPQPEERPFQELAVAIFNE